ncbi:hypothetical protein [Terrisporobacter glycolicus]|uniref:DUF2178 domain-containing protein n=1 Tax=Terrisporobacter glycolicus ATCC 14880 = DSM 1288 TaxID=1121315 RepID=A0ABZ2ER30_9FIRM|nr:hypothetical protein [Terrisporobacter glycolicus]
MKKSLVDYSFTILGILLLGLGLFLIKSISNPQGIMQTLPYICVGLGCGVFGHGMGNILGERAMKNNPEIKKQLEIEQNDERNIAIGNAAKAKAYEMMIYVFGALILSLALMGVDMAIILLLVFSYLFVVFYGIFYRFKYDKEM